MSQTDLERQILDFVNAAGYRPVKPRVIAKHLHLSDDAQQDFKRVLKRMIKSGRIAYGSSHLILPVETVKAVHESAGEENSLGDGRKPPHPGPLSREGRGENRRDSRRWWEKRTKSCYRDLSAVRRLGLVS